MAHWKAKALAYVVTGEYRARCSRLSVAPAYPEEGPHEPGHEPLGQGQDPGRVELKGTGHPLGGAAVRL